MNMQQKIVKPAVSVVGYTVYIAHSPGLAKLAEACCGRLALKIGFANDVDKRMRVLNGEDSYDDKKKLPPPPCCGFKDWKLFDKVDFDSWDVAFPFETLMLSTFKDRVIDHKKITSSDGWKNRNVEPINGEKPKTSGNTEVRLMPKDFFEMNFDDFLKQNFEDFLKQNPKKCKVPEDFFIKNFKKYEGLIGSILSKFRTELIKPSSADEIPVDETQDGIDLYEMDEHLEKFMIEFLNDLADDVQDYERLLETGSFYD